MRIHEINPEEVVDEGWYYDAQGIAKFDPHSQVHNAVLDPIALVNATHVRNNYLFGPNQTASPRVKSVRVTVDLTVGAESQTLTTQVPVISAFKVVLDKIVGYTLWKEIKRSSVDSAALSEFMELTLGPIHAMLTSLFTGPVDMIVCPGSMQKFNALYLEKLKNKLNLSDDQVFLNGLDKRVLVLPGETNQHTQDNAPPPIIIGASGTQQDHRNTHAILQALRTYRDPRTGQLEMKRIPQSIGNIRLRDNIKRFVYARSEVVDRLGQLLARPTRQTINIVILDDDMYAGTTMNASARELYYTAADLVTQSNQSHSASELAKYLESTIKIIGVTSLYNVPPVAYTNVPANKTPEEHSKHNPTFLAHERAVNVSRARDANLFMTDCNTLFKQGFSLLDAPVEFQLDSARFPQLLEIAQKYSVLTTLLNGSLSDIETKLPDYFFQRQFLHMFSAPVAFAVIYLLKQRGRHEILNKFNSATLTQITRSYDQVLKCYQQAYSNFSPDKLNKYIESWAEKIIARFNVIERVQADSAANQQRTKQQQTANSPQAQVRDVTSRVRARPWLNYITDADVDACQKRINLPMAAIINEFVRKYVILATTVAPGFKNLPDTDAFFDEDYIDQYPSTPKSYDKNSLIDRNVFMWLTLWLAVSSDTDSLIANRMTQLEYVWQDAATIAMVAKELAAMLSQYRTSQRTHLGY